MRIFFWSRGRKEFRVTGDHLKHRFLDLTKVTFWAGQGEENNFPVNGDHMKHRFIDITRVEFWACQEAENDF